MTKHLKPFVFSVLSSTKRSGFFAFCFFVISLSLKSQSQAICIGNSATITAPASFSTPTLNPGNIPANSNGQWIVTPITTTNYTVVTTSGAGTNTDVVVTVTVNPKPLVSPSFTQVTCTNSTNCFNLNLTFTPVNPVPTYTIMWSSSTATPNIPNGVVSYNQYSVCGNIAPGAYEATITTEGGCNVVTQFTMFPVPAPAGFSTLPAGNTHSINCFQPILTISADNPNNTYTWTSVSMSPVNGQSVTLNSSNLGSLFVTGTNTLSGCTSSKTLSIGVNTTAPVSALNPTIQNIICSVTPQPFTLTAQSPTINLTQKVISPQTQTGVFYANTFSVAYSPGGPGTYTYVLRNDVNGCETTKQFTVTSSDGYPSFTLASSSAFTIGCFSKSTTTISIQGVSTFPTPGQPASYQYIAPGGFSVSPPMATQTINIPGTWTVCVKDNSSSNGCVTRCPISITQNTMGPVIDMISIPTSTLTCFVPTVTLEAFTTNTNTAYNWTCLLGTNTLNFASKTLSASINAAVPTGTVVNNYTLHLTDPNNTCKTTTVLTLFQNIFPPMAKILTASLSPCVPPNVVLTNASSTTIPPTFPKSLPVVGVQWLAPTPQAPLQNAPTFVAATVGTYTLLAKDLNNGCYSKTTFLVEACIYSSLSKVTERSHDFLLWPNPSTGHLIISFSLEKETECTIELINMLGQPVKTILSPTHQTSGEVKISTELGALNSGLYFVRIRSGNEEALKKLILTH